MPGSSAWRVVWNRDFDREAAALFARFRDDRGADSFGALVAAIAPRLVPLVRSRLRRGRRHVDAHELIHDTFVRIYHAHESFDDRGPGSFVKWFLAIADNLARQDARADLRRAGREQRCARPVADRAADPFAQLLAGEEERLAALTWATVRRLALEAVQRLPASQWRAFVAFSRTPQTYEQLARELGVARGAAIMRVQRARQSVLDHIHAHLADGRCRASVAAMLKAIG